MKRLLIVGDLELPPGIEKVWQISRAVTFREAIARIRTESFDSIIVDSSSCDRDGIFLVPSFKRNSPSGTALLIAQEKLWAITEAAKQLGFDEVLCTHSQREDLQSLIENFLQRGSINHDSRLESKINRLSLREREILLDISTGATTVEIARKRHNSEATIKSHLSSIYRKLEVRNRVEAIAQIRT